MKIIGAVHHAAALEMIHAFVAVVIVLAIAHDHQEGVILLVHAVMTVGVVEVEKITIVDIDFFIFFQKICENN